ncbi:MULTISPECIES: hypothetical protein [Vibrio harveyi group]|uniref:hypothetical protein n=1 Tax=Vibrio harveyi group TaxID=717610 RepID=UPI0005F1971B|nr:hypothetical protein [Vibrio parahaemolyticus]EGQ9127132.1 hypothetical protein [Vibrio parahaemolyticus]EGR1007466.1 hypothetical protein [Vibrio parahaemolyticus]EGR1251216.1 hypothetical protein [Vibrio parahaemolyticus]EGR9022602.1 hypothetical protein [Vibrio parahaemolyticus]EIO2344426.1 hypothetical protein [Vibrio parahaemolyticus]
MNLPIQPVSYRLAFFFERELERPDKVFWELGNKITEFDDMPTVQPLPQGVRIEGYPTIIFKSISGMFSCEISSFRLDLIVNVGTRFGSLNPEILYREFKSLSNQIYSYLNTTLPISITRIGIVAESFIESEKGDPVNDIKSICNIENSSKLKEINIRMNRVNYADDFELNDILFFEVGRLHINGTKKVGIKASRDVNNVHIDGYTFEYDKLKTLLDSLLNLVEPTQLLEDIKCQNPQI